MSAEAERQFYVESIIISGFKRARGPVEVNLSREKSVLVGDNCAGKTTILEALHLALTGRYRNEPIRRAISSYLFNAELVSEFIDKSGTESCKLPEIEVEIFLGGGEEQKAELLSGAVNSKRKRSCGFTFRIMPDPEFAEELSSAVRDKHMSSLPVEYYEANWHTFANASISPMQIPVRSVLINPGGEWHAYAADERAARTLVDSLDDRERLAIAQEIRRSKDSVGTSIGIAEANRSIDGFKVLDGGCTKLTASRGTKDSWISELTIQANGVPYAHMGSGSQCMLQTRIALNDDKARKSSLILFEEPENHLSFSHLEELMEAVASAEGKRAIFTTHSSYVANKLDLDNLILLNAAGDEGIRCSTFQGGLDGETRRFFRKLPGYDTLRLVLSNKVILVEGPSDELVVQRAYRDAHGDHLPIDDGIDVISVAGLSFKRFLDIAKVLGKKVVVVTDNDGHPEQVAKKYSSYDDTPCIKICYASDVHQPISNDPGVSWNTLEPELLRANSLEVLNRILGKSCTSEEELVRYMERNKSDCALTIFEADENIEYPEYITFALNWIAND